MHLPTQDAPTSPQLQQQKSGQQGSCPPSPFDLMLRQDATSGMRSAASPFDFPMVHSAAPPAAPSMPSLGQGGGGLLGQGPMMSMGRSAVSPFDIPNGRVQQLLANSNINSSLGRPPPSPFDLPPSGRVPGSGPGRSPFDMALGTSLTSQPLVSCSFWPCSERKGPQPPYCLPRHIVLSQTGLGVESEGCGPMTPRLGTGARNEHVGLQFSTKGAMGG